MTKQLLIFTLLTGCFHLANSQELRGKLIPPPEVCEKGYEKGVSSQFVEFTPQGMVVAGGANFPDTPAFQGGKKVFYKGVYRLQNDKWTKINELSTPSACETHLTTNQNLLITNALHKNLISKQNISDTIYIELNRNIPSKLIQPIVLSDSNYIYIWGGFSLPAYVPDEGWKLNIKTTQWHKIAAPPTKNLTGATAIPYRNGYLIIGGVNRKIFQSALQRRANMTTAQDVALNRLKLADSLYMTMPKGDYKFNDKLLFYDPTTDKWKSLGHSPHLARAGASATIDTLGRLIVTGGEEKPGIRNPLTWIFDLNTLP